MSTTTARKEFIADLLKERIYATLALLAVLVSIDSEHSTALNAAFIISGTIISLWAASIVATQMSRRLVFQGELQRPVEVKRQVRRHAPMLAALIFPLFMIGLSALHFITLDTAITLSIISALLLLAGWSIGSARTLKANTLTTCILVGLELAIGIAVVALKVVVSH